MWRARYLMESYAELPPVLSVRGNPIQVTSVGVDRTGLALSVVTIGLSDGPIGDAYAAAWDIADELADRIAFLSYAPVRGSIISVTRPRVRIGEEFDLALPLGSSTRSRTPIPSGAVEDLDEPHRDEHVAIALRRFRTGLAAMNPYAAYQDLWRSLERLCDVEARERGLVVQHSCPNCGHQIPGGPASHQCIREKFVKSKPAERTDAEAVRLANEARQLRGMLAHGAKLEDRSLRERVELMTTSLQTAAAVALVDRTGMKPLVRHREVEGLPYLLLRSVIDADQPDVPRIVGLSAEIRVQMSVLPVEFGGGAHFFYEGGVQPVIEVSREMLPDVE